MRSRLVLLMVLCLVGLLAAPTVAAGARPKLSITNFHKSGTPGPEGETEWILTVEARDIDGVIWEVEVDWGDHAVAWASTFCVQGTQIGRKATLRIGHSYATPGTYRLRARAVSIPSCDAGFDDHQVGEWTSLRVTPRG